MKRKIPFALATALTLPALAAILPFTENFNSGQGDFTVEDTNDDGVKIKILSTYGYGYTDGMQYVSSANNNADDWLFTPMFNLKKGYIYKLTYQYKVVSSNSTHKIEWKAGASASSADMNIQVAPAKEVTYSGNWEKETVSFSVAEDGEYSLGLHLLSDAGQGTIYLDNIEIADGLNPAAPTAPVVATPAFSVEDNKLKASFEIDIPTTDNSGNLLDSAAEIEIVATYDGNDNVGSVSGLPGTKVVFIDEDAPAARTSYYFRALLGEDESAKTETISNPPLGTPKQVENFSASLEGNEFTLTWDAVTEAVNENDLLIPSAVTYLVKCNGVTVADNISATSTTYTYPLPEEGQEPALFTIVALASGRQSAVFTANAYMVGNPYSGEFKESFAGRTFSNKTWVIENNKGWSASIGNSYNPVVNPQDNDGGCLEFAFNGTQKIWSPVLDLSSLENPKLKFYAYIYPSSYYASTVQPGVVVNGEEIALGNPISLTVGTEGWTEFLLDIPAEAQEGTCQLMFTGTGESSYSGKFFIDNLSVQSYLDHNLAVSVSAPVKSLEIGQEVIFPVTIENKGMNVETDYTIALFANGEKAAEVAGTDVQSMENTKAELSFKVLPKYAGEDVEFSVVATLDNDGDDSDNEATVTIPVNENTFERAGALNAVLDPNTTSVALSWESPVVSTETTYTETTESFEDWEAGTMEAQNGWIFIDADGVDEKGINNINSNEKRAAMISESFQGVYSWEYSFSAFDGSKFLAISPSVSYGGEIDNWVISPEVKGGTTVTFQTVVMDAYNGSEAISVLWSKGGTAPEDFTEIDEVYSQIGDWKEKSFDLPAKAKRFAIRVSGTHYKAIAFDSFTFTAAASPAVHTGFNVYRDHELMATYPANTLAHIDQSPVSGKEHTYHVTALYDKGESHYSEPATVTIDYMSGIESVDTDDPDCEFYTLQGVRLLRPATGDIVIVRKADRCFKAIAK